MSVSTPTNTSTARSWARANYRGKAHLVEPGRRFACGTHTGYGMLIWTEESYGRCYRCVGILESREALERAQAKLTPAPAARPALEDARVSELIVGDVVWSWGMRLLIDTPPHRTGHPLDAAGETWAANAAVTYAPEGTTTAARWTVQGNDNRAVAREVRA